ncbi:fimbrial protein [Serratia liquefaciens]|uniref:fimbrial protein n=1 Tax=Serratia liquefaciens TaxID=614 RepID=UPI0015A260A7|nr:fimbrial protein [Serratia liquefaciens]NWA20851.1 fimbrial protein [Serratia liquefaciens]
MNTWRTVMLGCAVALLIILCSFYVNASPLLARCTGPGGYCSAGSDVIITYNNGGNLLINKNRRFPGVPSMVVVGYCNKSSGGLAGHCDYMKSTDIGSNMVDGSHPWIETVSMATGTFRMPAVTVPDLGYGYCVSAWVRRSAGTGDALSWGDNYYSDSDYALCSGDAPPPPPPNLCYVNSGNPVEVAFGNVERMDIGTSPGGAYDRQKALTVNCMGTGTHGINVRLNMSPTNWSSSQIATSNGALGVSVSADGKTLSNNDSFNLSVNGSTTSTLTFSLLRDPNKTATEIATGAFNASASLIVTEP